MNASLGDGDLSFCRLIANEYKRNETYQFWSGFLNDLK